LRRKRRRWVAHWIRLFRNEPAGESGPIVPLHVQLTSSTLRRVIMRLHFPLEIMRVCVRWYAAYALRLRKLEEMMAERGVIVDHASVHRWALKMLPVLAAGGSTCTAPSTSSARRWTSC
jgi:hypothetical protein